MVMVVDVVEAMVVVVMDAVWQKSQRPELESTCHKINILGRFQNSIQPQRCSSVGRPSFKGQSLLQHY